MSTSACRLCAGLLCYGGTNKCSDAATRLVLVCLRSVHTTVPTSAVPTTVAHATGTKEYRTHEHHHPPSGRRHQEGFVFTENGWQSTKPPKKKRTGLKIFLAIIAAGIVGIIILIALVSSAANSVSKSLDENANKPGGDSNPMTITEGKAFEVDGFNYSAGWSIKSDGLGYLDVEGLKVTNNRDDKDSALVEIKLWKGSEVLALADCSTEPIATGTKVSPSCTSGDKLPKSYDKVTINDTF